MRVETVIARIPGWRDADDISIEQIGGLTNTNYKVTVDDDHFVLRVSGGNTHFLGINRQLEREALQVASAHDLSPEIVHYVQPEGHLVTRWIDGRHWTYDEYCQPKNLRRIVKAVKEIHNLPPIQGEVSPFKRIKRYIDHVGELNVPFPNGFDEFVVRMEEIEASLKDDPFPARGLCHNDLFSLNFIDDGKIKFLDWEFAGMGNIFYDLATLAYTFDSVGEIPAELQDYILSCYFGNRTYDHKLRFEQMKFLILFYSAMWGLLQYGLQQTGVTEKIDGFNCLSYAQEMFAMMRHSNFWQNRL
jgi:thiamine kinase-like enzyme